MHVCEYGGSYVSDNGKRLLHEIAPLQATFRLDYERYIEHEKDCLVGDNEHPWCRCVPRIMDIAYAAYPPTPFAMKLKHLHSQVKRILRCDLQERSAPYTTYAELAFQVPFIYLYECQVQVDWRDIRFELDQSRWTAYPPTTLKDIKTTVRANEVLVNHYTKIVTIPLQVILPSTASSFNPPGL